MYSRFSNTCFSPAGTELILGTLKDALVRASSSFSLSCAVRNPGQHTEMRWLKRLERGEEEEEDGAQRKRRRQRKEAGVVARAKDVVKLDDRRYYRARRGPWGVKHV